MSNTLQDCIRNTASFTYYPADDITISHTLFSNELVTTIHVPSKNYAFQKTTCVDLRCAEEDYIERILDISTDACIKNHHIKCQDNQNILFINFLLYQTVRYNMPDCSRDYSYTYRIPLEYEMPIECDSIHYITLHSTVANYCCCHPIYLYTTMDFSLSI